MKNSRTKLLKVGREGKIRENLVTFIELGRFLAFDAQNNSIIPQKKDSIPRFVRHPSIIRSSVVLKMR